MKAEWANLPKRKCEACGEGYKPARPDQRFCKSKCRMDFHRYGGAFLKLKPIMEKRVDQRVNQRMKELVGTLEGLVRESIADHIKVAQKPQV